LFKSCARDYQLLSQQHQSKSVTAANHRSVNLPQCSPSPHGYTVSHHYSV